MVSDYTLQQQQNEIISKIKDYTNAKTEPLIQELYRLGYTYKQVGELLGVSKQAIMKKYPKKEV